MGKQPETNPVTNEGIKKEYLGLDLLTWIILGFFVLLTLVLAVRSYPPYRMLSRRIAATNAIKEQRYADAIPYLLDLSNNPRADQKAAWIDLANAYLNLKQPDIALKYLDQFQKANTGRNIDDMLGWAYFEKKDHKKAGEYFTRILREKPDDPQANFYLGVMLLDGGKLAEAGQRFQRAAGDPKWDNMAVPYRQEIAKRLQTKDTATTATAVAK
ncbi:tetratricopeptide repeat protein [bacterium]|nr:tetratricopeptide repeat protein [bacterium]